MSLVTTLESFSYHSVQITHCSKHLKVPLSEESKIKSKLLVNISQKTERQRKKNARVM